MKKFFFLLILFQILTNILFSQDIEKIVFYYYGPENSKYTITSDKIVIENSYEKKELDRNCFYLGKDGFYHFQFSHDNERIVIFRNNGKYYSFPLNQNDKNNDWIKSYKEYIDEENAYHKNSKFNSKYVASSELTENSIKYVAENLGTCFLPPDVQGGNGDYWNLFHKPWVEGVKGHGENESIKISTEEQFSRLEIINGYVDLFRKDLYKKNSRVRKFLVKDLDNKIEFEVTLKDEVIIQDIIFDKPTKNVILYVKEIYAGDKWDDTCITSIEPKK